ncbi:rhodanese-like domain-containing protein [Sphaerotilus sp.]|uniref:rhodanese-like domain-containing protein n=1 Tax=Sphaerotilus sp. TaxID=2093942 RepID=UPI002ACE6200|nr:rhodanese-like domain-containing protein [Sphaerotilus sp.]MDZ7855998.1 rhodanese-like domain-containing protein [Sphaerotilus sp.]
MTMFERMKRRLLPAAPAQPDTAEQHPAAHLAPQPVPTRPPGPLVIDVRSEREFHATAVAQAVNVPLPQLAHRIGELAPDKTTPLVLYCASGTRSGIACGVLTQLGYAHVTNAGSLYAAAERLQREVRR